MKKLHKIHNTKLKSSLSLAFSQCTNLPIYKLQFYKIKIKNRKTNKHNEIQKKNNKKTTKKYKNTTKNQQTKQHKIKKCPPAAYRRPTGQLHTANITNTTTKHITDTKSSKQTQYSYPY